MLASEMVVSVNNGLSGNFTPEPGPTIWEWVVECSQVVLVCVCAYGALSSYP